MKLIPMIGSDWIIGIQNAPSLIGNKTPPRGGVFISRIWEGKTEFPFQWPILRLGSPNLGS